MNYLLNFNLLFFIKNFKFLVLAIIRKQKGWKQNVLDLLRSELISHSITFEDARQSKKLKDILCGQELDWLEKHALHCTRFNAETLRGIM